MTLHYHGTPISPISAFETLAGRCFCVSYADPRDVERAHRIGQSVMLDNGAFSFWRRGFREDRETTTVEAAAEFERRRVAATPNWPAYYDWVESWLDYQTTWAVIPDVIDGTEEEQDLLLAKWHQRRLPRGAPVWHMHESIARLRRLCHSWPRVCIGSSGAYRVIGTPSWHRRMEQAMGAVCGAGSAPTWLHMLRGMAQVDAGYPFASVDSADIGQNHHRSQNIAATMAARWDVRQAPARWTPREQLALEAT